MKAAVLTEYKKIEWLDIETPSISDDEALIKVTYAGICGSDQHVFNGEFHPRSRLPLIQGHEFVGVIEKTGGKINNFKAGDRVAVDPIYWCGKCYACQIKHYPACKSLKLVGIDSDGGFAEYAVAKDFMLYKIPDNINDLHAGLVEPFSIGFHANNRAATKKDDIIAIFGAGRIGHCIMQVARTITKNSIFMIDVLANRLDLAKKACPDVICINSRETDPVTAIAEFTNGRGIDIAFEAVGPAFEIKGRVHPLREAIRSIRGAGKVCTLSLGDEEVPLVLKELILKEGYIFTSRVSHGEFKDALEYLSLGKLVPETLISKVLPLEKLQDAYEMLEKEPDKYLKVLLKSPGAC